MHGTRTFSGRPVRGSNVHLHTRTHQQPTTTSVRLSSSPPTKQIKTKQNKRTHTHTNKQFQACGAVRAGLYDIDSDKLLVPDLVFADFEKVCA